MEYIVTQNVDYLSFSTQNPLEPFSDKKYDNIKSPNSHYDSAMVLDSGALHLWHSTNRKMKHHYIYAGKPLQYLREQGQDELEVVQWCLEKANITRIDLAITSQPENEKLKHAFTPHALAWACRDQLLKSRMKPSKDISENMRTQTKYIGNRTSRARLFRAYDKGIEQGLVENFLIRYELETRRGTKTIARAVVSGENYGAIIRRYVDFPNQATWLEIMNSEPAHMQHEAKALSAREMDEQKSFSRWSWLCDSIPKTVKKALTEDLERRGIEPGENENFHKFISAIMKQLDMP